MIPGLRPIGANIGSCVQESLVIPPWDDSRITCDHDWDGLVVRLGGAALEQSARDSKAFLRARAVATGVDLLRLILTYCLRV
jgi:hypothetical protein